MSFRDPVIMPGLCFLGHMGMLLLNAAARHGDDLQLILFVSPFHAYLVVFIALSVFCMMCDALSVYR